MIHVKFFGPLAEIVGKSEMTIDNVNDMNALLATLRSKYPKLSEYKTLLSVNKKITNENLKLNDGDEIALLPPFAGG